MIPEDQMPGDDQPGEDLPDDGIPDDLALADIDLSAEDIAPEEISSDEAAPTIADVTVEKVPVADFVLDDDVAVEASADAALDLTVDPDDVDLDAHPELVRAIEAVVLAATEPVDPHLLAQLTERPIADIVAICNAMVEQSELEGRGFVLARVAGGYRFQTHPDLSEYVERFVLEGQHARLSPAALETLAIVAYKQPISRAQASAIRGVNVDAVVKTLNQKGLITEVGTDPGPGNATLYGTTSEFLERLGLDSLADLPPLSEFVPDASIVETLERTLRAEPVEIEPANEPAEAVSAPTASSDD